MSGLTWKRNADEILERRKRFFRRKMQDGILATLPVKLDTEKEWVSFEKKWGKYAPAETRPFPSNQEIFERSIIGLKQRGQVEDDKLPVVYSILDAGESMVGGMFGKPMQFFHRPRHATYSKAETVISDYSELPRIHFSMDNEWVLRFLSIERYFEEHCGGLFAQHPCLTMDALNFAAEMREATEAYLDIYEHPEELKALMEIGLGFNVEFQEAQQKIIGKHVNGSFNWLGGWVPFPASVSLSVDAYVICSVETFVKFGFDYQRRLIEHFGHGLMHFHCNRTDLAAEVAKLPNLELFQFGGDTRDEVPSIDRVPEMRRAVGDLPIMVNCDLQNFLVRLADHTLMPNVWYDVKKGTLTIDDANRLMDKVRTYKT